MAPTKQHQDRSRPQVKGATTPSRPDEGMADPPALSISRDKICFIVFKARQFDVKDLPTVPDDGSNPADEGIASVLEDRPDDPVARELVAFISALTFDEQVDLVTLTWLGRGDGTLADWSELRDTACSEHNRRTAHYLLGTPLLADYLSEGLAQFGYSCEEFAHEHLTP